MKKLLTAVCMVALLAGISFAKSTPVKKSLGYNTQTGQDALSYRVWTGKNGIGWEALFGYSIVDLGAGSGTNYVLGGKYLKCIKKEKNLKTYFFGMLALTKTSTLSTVAGPLPGTTVLGMASTSGTAFGGGLGVEFFLNGLPNLGFGSELTFIIDSTDGAKYTGILAGPATSVGIRYYFD